MERGTRPQDDHSLDRLARELKEANERLVLAGLRQQELADDAHRARTQLEALLENMAEGVAVFGPEAELVLINSCGRELHGFPAKRPITADDFRACDFRWPGGARLDFDRDLLGPLLRGERFSDVEVVVVRQNGARRHLLLNGSIVRDGGAVTLAIQTARDVTDLRKLEQLRERTMAAISHDLRGPIGTTKMAVEFLANTATEEQRQARVFERLLRNVDRMERMVGDLLDAQRLHAGERLQLALSQCDLAKLAREVVEELRSVDGDRFVLEAPASLIGYWAAEELRRALWNLATNAVKYGAPRRPVTITVAPDGERVALSVHNEGPPISEAVRELLFRPFARPGEDEVGGAHSAGWGLGLALVRGYAEAHGGTVDLQSDERGTTFTLELPRDAR